MPVPVVGERPLAPASLRRLAILLAVLLTLAVAGTRAPNASAAGDGIAAVFAGALAPNYVPGANDPNCRPSPEHPNPVVLVHGTLASPGPNFASIGPRLRDAGYCAYSMPYGMLWYSFGRLGGLGDIAESANTLARFVDRVRSETGAKQVDIVGHSQGGMMPNYYIKRLGGASKVRRLVGLASSNHGTTLSGIAKELPAALGSLGAGLFKLVTGALDKASPGLAQQVQGSPFQTALFQDGDTVPGPRYTVIETKHDRVVTPYTNAFLQGPNVNNVLIQDLCPNDPVGHIGLAFDEPTIQLILNALGDDSPSFKPECRDYGPQL